MRSSRYVGGGVMDHYYSSIKILEEMKCRIKERYKSQANFGKTIGLSRKSVSRILNKGTDMKTFFMMCRILGIEGITIE